MSALTRLQDRFEPATLMAEPSPVLKGDVPDGPCGAPDPQRVGLRIRHLSAAIASGDLLASYALGVLAIRAVFGDDKSK